MAVRCPTCQAPLADEEASTRVCPACAAPLPGSPDRSNAAKPAEPDAGPTRGGLRIGWVLFAWAAVVILGGIHLADSVRRGHDAAEIAHLREGKEALDLQLRAAQRQTNRVQANMKAVAGKLAAAEKSALAALAQVQVLEQAAVAERERLQNLLQEHQGVLSQLEALQAFNNPQPDPEAGRPIAPVLEEPLADEFQVIKIDRPDGDYFLPTPHLGARIKLVGQVKTLRLEHIHGSTLDAGELTADEISVQGINDGSKFKVNAPGGLVNIPFIDNKSHVEIASPDGEVQIGWVHGGAQVHVIARDCTFDHLDGPDTTMTVTLTTAGQLQFQEIRGQTQLLWRKARADDPDVQLMLGAVRPPAECRGLVPGR